MTPIPANLGQRILDAARIATAIHQEQALQESSTNASAGGAGARAPFSQARTDVDLDGWFATDDAAPRLRMLRP